MARIRDKDAKLELFFRKLCHSMGLRFRLYGNNLPGKPDLVFKRHNTVTFVHGCFWHMHNCKYGKVVPKTNAAVWKCETKDISCLTEKLKTHFDLQKLFLNLLI